MISRRTVTVLGTLALVATIGAALAVTERLAETQRTTSSERAFPDIGSKLPGVNVIQIRRADDHEIGSVTLSKSGDGWIVEERDGYPARDDLVRELFFDITELELIESKTSEPGRFDRLDLRDVAQDGSRARRLVLTTAEGETVVDAHFGKVRDSLSGGEPMVYMRRTDQNQTYLAEGELDLHGTPQSWVFRGISDVPREQVIAARIETPGGEVLRLEKSAGDSDFTIIGLPEGREIKSQYSVNNIGAVLKQLVFEDVRSADGLVTDPALGSALYGIDGGARILISFAQDGVDEEGEPILWMLLSADTIEGASDDAKALVESVEAETGGWAYRVSDYIVQRFRTRLDDLLKPASDS